MNYTSMQMQDTLRRLEATLPEAPPPSSAGCSMN